MLSSGAMKHPSENNLNIFASFLLGGMGMYLLLIPESARIVHSGQPAWSLIFLGGACFILSLCLQVTTILPVPLRRVQVFQFLAAILLILFAKVYQQYGFIAEGSAFWIAGIAQILLLFPFVRKWQQIDLFNLAIALISFIAGLHLSLSRSEQIVAQEYVPLLATGFLLTAFLSASTTVLPSFKFNHILQRLPIIPWLVWMVLYVPAGLGANFIAAVSITLLLLAKDLFPWHQILVPEGDILGRRVIMIGATIEIFLLLFLSILLLAADNQFSEFIFFLSPHEAAFYFFLIVVVVINYEVLTILMTINGLMQELSEDMEKESVDDDEAENASLWTSRMARYLRPYMLTREGIRLRLNAQADQIQTLSRQLVNEKKRNAQLTLLMELSQQLESQLDQPVAAQLAVNTLERALNCSLATIYIHEAERKEFMLIASAGRQSNLIPAGYRQPISSGAIGRAYRQRKTQIITDISLDADYIPFENENNLSALLIPLIHNGHMNGVIALTNEAANAFSSIDIGLAETVAAELTRAWERSGYHQRLTDLIQAGSQLSSLVDPTTTAQDVAAIAREILQAKFTFVHIQLGQERNFIQSASSGHAPRLLNSLETSIDNEDIIQIAFQASQPFRVRDLRKYNATASLLIDNATLRSMLIIPIRWHQVNIGGIFAFGKQNEVFFTENDESLAELLSIQAAGAFESTWLQQELRSSLRITSLLYRLSNQIILAENLESAASDIAQTAHKLTRSSSTGIVLFNSDDSISAEVKINAVGEVSELSHPMSLLKDAMNSGQLIYFSQGQSMMRTCVPIQTPIRKYGAVWMDIPDEPGHKTSPNPNDMQALQALVSQAAIALERSLLLAESRRQAVEIKAAYDKLETTYDQTLASLVSALDARDRETEGHSLRVSHLSVKLGKALGFTSDQLKVLERGSILHDIGKIGISDSILHKPGPLNDQEWLLMKQHPDIGARIVEGIPFLQDTIPIIRHHQERWNGTGYPSGLKGEEIPLLARLFAVVDAFDALTSNRPYRKKISIPEAIHYLREEAGILFDPYIVDAFERMAAEDETALVLTE